MCPECGSTDLRERFAHFREEETGYSDCSLMFRCMGCGAMLDDSEVIKPATQQEPK
jgi:hypothetical protein